MHGVRRRDRARPRVRAERHEPGRDLATMGAGPAAVMLVLGANRPEANGGQGRNERPQRSTHTDGRFGQPYQGDPRQRGADDGADVLDPAHERVRAHELAPRGSDRRQGRGHRRIEDAGAHRGDHRCPEEQPGRTERHASRQDREETGPRAQRDHHHQVTPRPIGYDRRRGGDQRRRHHRHHDEERREQRPSLSKRPHHGRRVVDGCAQLRERRNGAEPSKAGVCTDDPGRLSDHCRKPGHSLHLLRFWGRGADDVFPPATTHPPSCPPWGTGERRPADHGRGPAQASHGRGPDYSPPCGAGHLWPATGAGLPKPAMRSGHLAAGLRRGHPAAGLRRGPAHARHRSGPAIARHG